MSSAIPPSGVIGVVGAGAMGTGIAQVALVAGLKVTMVDLSEDAVAKAHGRIDAGLKKLVEKVFK